MPKALTVATGMFGIHSGFYAYIAPLPVALAAVGYGAADIGLIVGIASLIQIPAALVGGVLIRRVGARAVFYGTAGCYAIAAIAYVLGVADSDGTLPAILVTRAMQGLGLGFGLPSALALVTGLPDVRRRGLSLAVVASSHNLALAVLPPVALIIFEQSGMRGVGAVVLVLVVLGVIVGRLAVGDGGRQQGEGESAQPAAPAPWLRRQWIPLLAVLSLSTFYFGIVTAYLPLRAADSGTSVALFFTADALAVVASRVPAGVLADRVDPRILLFIGLSLTVVGLAALIAPATPVTLVLAGSLCGLGAGIGVTAVLVMLQRQSTVTEAGSVFGLFSVATALGITAGSIAGGLVVSRFGFEAGIAVGLLCVLISIGVTWVSGSRGAHQLVQGQPLSG